MAIKKSAFLLIVIAALAAFLRLYNLKNVPPGLYPDEAMNGNNALEAIATGNFKVFYPENNGREGLFINIQAVFLKFLLPPANQPEPWMLRLPAAIFGILTVLGIYFLAKELFDKNSKHEARNSKQILNLNDRNSRPFRVSDFEFRISHGEKIALLSSFFLAVSFWHINFSRIGFRAIMAPFFLTWAIYFLLKSFRLLNTKYSKLNAVGAGLFYGLGFYSYIAYRSTPLLILIILFFFLRNAKAAGRQKQTFLSIFCFLFSAFLVFLPLGIYFFNHPADFFGRTAQISVFNSPTLFKDLSLNILKTVAMFNISGDWNPRHNIPGAPLLWWPVGIMFLVGLFLAARSVFKKSKLETENSEDSTKLANTTLLAWLIFAAAPVVLSNEGLPHALRAILMAPAVFILSAAGGLKIYEWLLLKTKSKKFLAIACFLALFVLTVQSYQSYFERWAKNKETEGAFAKNYVEIGRELNLLPKDAPKYVVVKASGVLVRGIPMPAQTVMFITDTFLPEKQKEKNIYYILPENSNQIPKGAIIKTID